MCIFFSEVYRPTNTNNNLLIGQIILNINWQKSEQLKQKRIIWALSEVTVLCYPLFYIKSNISCRSAWWKQFTYTYLV